MLPSQQKLQFFPRVKCNAKCYTATFGFTQEIEWQAKVVRVTIALRVGTLRSHWSKGHIVHGLLKFYSPNRTPKQAQHYDAGNAKTSASLFNVIFI
jgi:hypothetical protein